MTIPRRAVHEDPPTDSMTYGLTQQQTRAVPGLPVHERVRLPYLPRVKLTRDDVDDVLAAAWSQVEPLRTTLAVDAQPALEVGVPAQAHPGRLELLCTVSCRYEVPVIKALLKGLTDSGYVAVERDAPEMVPGQGEPFVMRSILVSGRLLDDVTPAPAAPWRWSAPEPESQVRSALEDVDLAARHAGLAVHAFTTRHQADLEQMTEVDREAVTLRFLLLFMVSQGLIVVSPDGAFERSIPLELDGPYAANLAGHMAQARTRFAAMARLARP